MRYSLIILLALSFTLQAEDAKPQPLEVQNAMAALEKSIVAARKVYDPIVTKAVGDAVLKLNLVKADYMKKNDLEGANMIVDAIAKLKEGSVVGEIEEHVKSNSNLFADNGIVGKWMMNSVRGELVEITINQDFSAIQIGHTGKVTVNENGSFTILWENGYKHTPMTWNNKVRGYGGNVVDPNGTIATTIIYKRLPTK